jgi:hypothetical protein
MSYYTDEYRHEQFLATVRQELHLRHVPFDRRDFDEFMRVMGPLILPEGDNPVWWADTVLEAMVNRVGGVTDGPCWMPRAKVCPRSLRSPNAGLDTVVGILTGPCQPCVSRSEALP